MIWRCLHGWWDRELWRVGWRPSTSSITRWWTWEAGPWQVEGVAGVEDRNGVRDRAGEGSRLRWLEEQVGEVDGEKCGQDWGQGCFTGVLDSAPLAWLNVCVRDKDGLSVFACHVANKRVTPAAPVKTLVLYHVLQLSPVQMMNLVIRSSVTPFSKSCRGVMSLKGPLASYAHWNEDQRHQSRARLKRSRLLSNALPSADSSSAEAPRSCRTLGGRARERGSTLCRQWEARLRPAWPVLSDSAAWSRAALCAHTQMLVWNGFSDLWPRSPRGPACLPSFCAWLCDHMFSSVWPKCSHV